MRFRIKDIKFFAKFGPDAARISKILSDTKGEDNEKRAFHVVENYLRIFIREKVEQSKKRENIEFSAQRCGTDPGRDIRLTLLYPLDVRGEKINIEVKSSEQGIKEHREKGKRQLRYRTEAVVVNKKRSDKKIARSIFALIEREIKRLRKEQKNN